MFAPILPPLPEDMPDLANETLGSFSLRLKVPFVFKGRFYWEVSLRIPTGRDIRDYLANHENLKPVEAHDWLTQLIEAPPAILDVMHAADYVACIECASNLTKI